MFHLNLNCDWIKGRDATITRSRFNTATFRLMVHLFSEPKYAKIKSPLGVRQEFAAEVNGLSNFFAVD